MTRERATESQVEQLTEEQFLDCLYNKIIDWLKNNNSEVIHEFGPQTIDYWAHHQDMPGSGAELSLDLQKGIILKDEKRIFGVASGIGYTSKHAHKPTLRLHFGFQELSLEPGRVDYSDPQQLKRLVVKRLFSWQTKGEFFVHPVADQLMVSCWPDNWPFGGKQIGKWPQERLLTEEGLSESLHLVQELVRRYVSFSSGVA